MGQVNSYADWALGDLMYFADLGLYHECDGDTMTTACDDEEFIYDLHD